MRTTRKSHRNRDLDAEIAALRGQLHAARAELRAAQRALAIRREREFDDDRRAAGIHHPDEVQRYKRTVAFQAAQAVRDAPDAERCDTCGGVRADRMHDVMLTWRNGPEEREADWAAYRYGMACLEAGA